jgi:hypothetical protein
MCDGLDLSPSVEKRQPMKGRGKRGQGKRQFFACYDRIQELAGKGCNPLLIYEILCKEGLISLLSYSCFYDHLSQRKRKKRLSCEQTEAVLPPALPQVFMARQTQAPARPSPRLVPAVAPPGGSNNNEARPRNSLQELLDESQKEMKKYLNASSSDPELEKIAERLVGK